MSLEQAMSSDALTESAIRDIQTQLKLLTFFANYTEIEDETSIKNVLDYIPDLSSILIRNMNQRVDQNLLVLS